MTLQSTAIRKRLITVFAAAAICAASATVATAQDKAREAEAPRPIPATAIAPVTTQHRLALPSGPLDYRVTAETLPAMDSKHETVAQIAVISYSATGMNEAERPVTFVFNGGPGASSAFLHLGALGPRVLVTGPSGGVPAPPGRLEDNSATWLAFTDLVFIDPVGTGLSYPMKPGEDAEKAFWSVSGDTRSLAEVIRLWLARNGRWASPKFMAGESYGGFRIARIARQLLDDQGVAFNGLIMISPALDFSIISPGPSDVLPWAVALPSMVAAARSHGKGDTATSLEEVERFALTDYLAGIAAIAPPGPGPDPSLITRISDLLGLEQDLVRRHLGRVSAQLFAEHLLGEAGQSLSLYDGTLAGVDPRPGHPGPDPQLDAIKAPLASAYNAYLHDALGLTTDLPFRILNRDVSRTWDWQGARGQGERASAMTALAELIALTPGLRALVVHGRTDMVTPYMASRWLLDRLDLPEDARARVSLAVLEGGHMMYFRDDQRQALSRLAAEVVTAAPPAKPGSRK